MQTLWRIPSAIPISLIKDKIMDALLQLAARLYAPVSTAQYFADAELRLREQCPQSVKHEAKLPPSNV